MDFSTNVSTDFINSIVPIIIHNLMANNNSVDIDGVSYPAAIDMVFEGSVPQMNGSFISAGNVSACTSSFAFQLACLERSTHDQQLVGSTHKWFSICIADWGQVNHISVYITNHQGQLRLPFLRGRQIKARAFSPLALQPFIPFSPEYTRFYVAIMELTVQLEYSNQCFRVCLLQWL